MNMMTGDSGAGMHWGETIDGLHVRRWNPINSSITDRGFMHTAEDVRDDLRGTFDYNCWHNGQTNRHRSDWLATCPTIDR